jgi:3'(2'), 5'-bisphosphate nucleotidase
MKQLLALALEGALEAGRKILEVYQQDFTVETKADNSPLTLADRLAHKAIKIVLSRTDYPVLSEEGKEVSFEQRIHWETFGLVDPLDGTKEFIKKNGEFTVNIALVKMGMPVLGIVYIPVTGALYFGAENLGSFCVDLSEQKLDRNIDNIIHSAQRLPDVNNRRPVYTIVASRSHLSNETEVFIQKKKEEHGDVELISSGSSIKLCLVAEGKADIYPRLAPTMEWDTAAGHAIAKFAGCKVYNFATLKELVYNKEDLLNAWFVCERK